MIQTGGMPFMTKNTETSRRVILRTGLGLVAAAGAATGAKAQEKLAPALVQYQATPKDGLVCSKCVNWVAPNACNIVSGVINPNGWCVAYAPKEG
jgi:hypothetical protein